MNEEELDSIQELIERKLLMAEVMGGLTSQDKKFINLWNYAMQLQNNWNELKNYIEEWLIKNETWYSNSLSTHDKNYYRKDYLLRKANLTEIKNKMQELDGKDE